MTRNWTGVPGSPGDHRSVSPWRAWCSRCDEECSIVPDRYCSCCEDFGGDPYFNVRRSELLRWAWAVRDEVGLDAVLEEIRAVLISKEWP